MSVFKSKPSSTSPNNIRRGTEAANPGAAFVKTRNTGVPLPDGGADIPDMDQVVQTNPPVINETPFKSLK